MVMQTLQQQQQQQQKKGLKTTYSIDDLSETCLSTNKNNEY
jgi:hypothetical protein